MLTPDEEQWVRSTANDLNNLLQVIANSTEQLAAVLRGAPGTERYVTMLQESTARAAVVTKQLAEKVGGPPAPAPAKADAERPKPQPAVQPAPPVQSTPVAITIHNPTGHRELIMIVDDEEFVAMLTSRVLVGAGFRVVTARDGSQAIDFYKRLRGEISMVILDYAMPGLDGAQVFNELQQINPSVAVLLSSGFTEQEKLRLMTSRGLKGFIPKPYTNHKLLDHVEQILRMPKR